MILIFILAFCIGSVPCGQWVARIFKVKNMLEMDGETIDAPAVSHEIGFWLARIVSFFLDVGKGVLAVFLVTPAGHQMIEATFPFLIVNQGSEASLVIWWMAGLMAVLGHCFSPWLRFKGGKGVATGLGVVLVLSPVSALFGIIGFVIAFLYKRIVPLASIAGLLLTLVTYVVLNPTGVYLWIGGAIILLILIRHEASIDALLALEENKF